MKTVITFGTFDVFHVGHLCRYRADILVMGDDWAGKFDDFSCVCEVVYFPRTPSVSTTGIIEVIRGHF